MKTENYNAPVKISDHVYWVGNYDPTDSFQCNAYLILVHGKGVIIDPGSVLYFEDFVQKVAQLIEFESITHIIIQHQDPDVCGNIALLMDTIQSSGNESCKIITHKRTAALIRHYGGDFKFEYSDKFPGEKLYLGNKQTLEFIHTPYLHAPGAIATYFSEDKILFSGDIFGGMTEGWDLYADEDYFEKIKAFHQDYMPAKELLLFAMTKFDRYEIEKIAPQHGSVLNKKQVFGELYLGVYGGYAKMTITDRPIAGFGGGFRVYLGSVASIRLDIRDYMAFNAEDIKNELWIALGLGLSFG